MTKNHVCFLLLLFLLVGSGCRKPIIDETPDWEEECTYGVSFVDLDPEGIASDGLLPLNIHNYWLYADTIRNAEGEVTETSTFLLHPTQIQYTNNDVWWTFNDLFPPIHQSNDTLYFLDRTFPSTCLVKNVEFYSMGRDTIEYTIVRGGEIALLRQGVQSYSTVHTPAGDFTDCLYFRLANGFNETHTLKPGVGFVKMTWPSFMGQPSQELTLIEYHIE